MYTIVLTLLLAADPAPTINAYAGTGTKGYSGDNGPATKAQLNNPFDVALDAQGNLFFSDTFNHCVRRVDAKTGIISTIAGCGKAGFGGDDGPATQALLKEPYGVTLDAEGVLYIVDRLNFCIRRVDPKTSKISTVAGIGGQSGSEGDGGPATKAKLKEPNGIALDGKGKLYIADVADQRVRVVDLSSGQIATACGNGKKASLGDNGPYKDASLMGPRAVAVGPDGNLYICEREGNSIRKIDFKSGKITRVAGTGKKGYTGDGASALEATFNGPKEIDIDTIGNIFVVDTENQAIRRIDAQTGKISTVAGNGKRFDPKDDGDRGPATAAGLGRPHGVVVAPDGRIFIGDTETHKIRVVEVSR